MISPPVRHRFTVDDLLRMEESGVFAPDQRIELIDGEIIDMSPINQRHATCVRKLIRFFQKQLPFDKYILDAQNTLQLTDYSLPQPDIVIARFRPELLANEHIQPGDVVLLVEVSDTTYQYDSTVKLSQYASAGIPVYWIINLNKRQVEVYTQPEKEQYLHSEIHEQPFSMLEGITISPGDIFPSSN